MAGQKTVSNYNEMKIIFSAELNGVSFTNADVDNIRTKWNSFDSRDNEKRLALEQALRDKLLKILEGKDRLAKKLKAFMNFLLGFCNLDMILPITFVSLISDVLESLTLQDSEDLFEFVETRVSLWKSQPYFTSCKNIILRMCNDLLRRLSKVQNTIFCGRILLFLAMFFPFSERSGLNIVSEFNVDGFIKYGENGELIDDEEPPLQTVEIPIKLDSSFYSEFWSLQEYFRSPTLCYNKKQWKDFVKHTNSVLSVFKNYKLDWESDPQNVKSKHDKFFTKFLTNPKLLLLQLSDTDFRRTIYLQFLVLFQFLTLQCKAKQDVHNLKADQLDWIKSSTETLYQLIKESPPDGEKFLDCVQLILKRDEHWSTWKNEGCPALKPAVPNFEKGKIVKPNPPKKITTAHILHRNNSINKLIVPRPEEPEIIDMRQNYLKYLPGRNRSPEVNEFLAEAIQQSESSEPIDIKDKKVSDPQFAWIALKLLSLKSPHFFSVNAQNPIPKLPEFVDHICRRIYREQNPGLLLPPLMPAPKTMVKNDVKKDGIKSTPNSGKVQKVVKVDKQVKVLKTQSGKLIKINSDNSQIKTVKVGDKIVKQIIKPSPNSILNSTGEKVSRPSEKSLDKTKSDSIIDKNDSKISERTDRVAEKSDRSERSERSDRLEKSERTSDKSEKSDKSYKQTDKSDKYEKLSSKSISSSLDRSDKYEKSLSTTSSRNEKPPSKTEKSSLSSLVSSSSTSKNDRSSSDKKSEKPSERTEKNSKSSSSTERERNSERQQLKKERSPVKRKRSVDNDLEDKESSPAIPKKSKDKRDERRDDKDDDGLPTLTKEQISKLAKSISGSWKKVAEKLGYKPDEIELFESQQDADYSRAVNLLLVWCSNEDDATPDSLKHCLKNLGLTEAVKILSSA